MQKHPLRLFFLVCAAALPLACGEPPADASGAAGPVSERISASLALEAPLPRVARLASLLTDLDAEALPEVRRAFVEAGLDASDGGTELVLLATWWAGFDPVAALEWTRRDWRAPASAQVAILRRWAQSDPRAAWARAVELGPALREGAKDAVIASWHDHDAADLEAFVAGLPAGEARQRGAEALGREKAEELGAEAALAWADGLESAEFRDLMRNRVAGAAGLIEPEVAAAWATPQIDGDPRSNGLARRVATRWVLSDPVAAMEWLATLPAGGTRDDGVLEAYRDWLRLAPLEALDWIAEQEVAPWLEPALSLHARGSVAPEDPEGAFALAAQFSDERLRATTQTYLARQWLQRDYAAADAWIQQSDLPEDIVKRAYMLPSPQLREKRAAARRAQRAEALGLDELP